MLLRCCLVKEVEHSSGRNVQIGLDEMEKMTYDSQITSQSFWVKSYKGTVFC